MSAPPDHEIASIFFKEWRFAQNQYLSDTDALNVLGYIGGYDTRFTLENMVSNKGREALRNFECYMLLEPYVVAHAHFNREALNERKAAWKVARKLLL